MSSLLLLCVYSFICIRVYEVKIFLLHTRTLSRHVVKTNFKHSMFFFQLGCVPRGYIYDSLFLPGDVLLDVGGRIPSLSHGGKSLQREQLSQILLLVLLE